MAYTYYRRDDRPDWPAMTWRWDGENMEFQGVFDKTRWVPSAWENPTQLFESNRGVREIEGKDVHVK